MVRAISFALLAIFAALYSSSGEARKPRSFACAAAAQYGSQPITVSLQYTAGGQRSGTPTVSVGKYIPAEVAETVVAQLTDVAERLAANPEQNCTPDTWKDELQYERFTCDESWTDGLDRFELADDGDRITVQRTYPSGMKVYTNQQSYYIDRSPFEGSYWDEDFLRDGLGHGVRSRLPFIYVSMPMPWGSDRTLQYNAAGKLIGDSDELGEARVGEKFIRSWSNSNNLLFMPADVLDPLLSEPGDIILTAYSIKRGLVAREVLPRDFREQWEEKLKQGYRRLLAKQADPVNRCQHILYHQGPPIIIVD